MGWQWDLWDTRDRLDQILTQVSSNRTRAQLEMLMSRVEQLDRYSTWKLVRSSNTQLSIEKYLNLTFFYIIVGFNMRHLQATQNILDQCSTQVKAQTKHSQNLTPVSSTQLKLEWAWLNSNSSRNANQSSRASSNSKLTRIIAIPFLKFHINCNITKFDYVFSLYLSLSHGFLFSSLRSLPLSST